MDEDRQIQDIVNQLYEGPITHKISNKDSVRIKYAQSYFQQITVSASQEDQFQQSQVIQKDSVKYQAKQISDNQGEYLKNQNTQTNRRMSDPLSVVVKQLSTNLNSFAVPITQSKNNHTSINTNQNGQPEQVKQSQSPFSQNLIKSNQSKNEQYNNEIQISQVDTKIVQKFQSIKSSNFHEISKIYYYPTQINLPEFLQQNNQVQKITPYIFNHPTPTTKQQNQQKQSKPIFQENSNKSSNNSQYFQMAQSYVQQQTITNKITNNQNVTDILLQKINELSIKVKQLQTQKKQNQKIIKDNKLTYSTSKSIQVSSTNHPNQHNHILFSTTSSAQTKFAQKFKEKQKYKINSNIISLKFNANNNNSIIDQINSLKQKLEFLQKKQFNNFNQNISQFNQTETNDRKQFKGKIVRRKGSNGTPIDSTYFQNDFQAINEQSIYSKQQIFENSKDDAYQSKKINIRKVPGSAIQRSRAFHKENQNQSHTLEFNISKEKLVVQESRQFNFKNQQSYPTQQNTTDDIEIPQLEYFPSSENSLQDLVQIGKLALEKFGCPVDTDTPFYVKKYKNCVHYKLNNFNILWHFDGKMYLGGWTPLNNGQGQKTGQGIQFIPGKYKFKGTFIQGKRCGFGKIIFQNGTIYVGQWLNGLKHGKGKLRQSNGLEYQGEWRNGKKNGSGIIRIKQKKQFQGIFKNNLKNGFGKQSFQNGDYYQGFYQNNKFHGKGKYIWKGTANYNGEFKQGKRHGYGLWRSLENNYDEYQGNYYEDNKNGQGIYRWSNGAVYNGGFKNDQKHGQGTLMYPNGRIEKLNWVNGTAQKKNPSSNRSNQSRQKSISNSKTKLIMNSKTQRKNILSKQLTNKITRTNSANINPNFQRAIPKGLSFKKLKQQPNIDNQFKNKLKITNFIQSQHQNHNFIDFDNTPKDPPYKSMKTSSIINFNNI